jgi:hypothetical protein
MSEVCVSNVYGVGRDSKGFVILLCSDIASWQMGRSAGMLPGGSYVPHRQLQQQLAGTVSGSMASMNASDLQHLHANIADSFPSSHGLSASYHSQVRTHMLLNVKRGSHKG